jgi:hypothetical protein
MAQVTMPDGAVVEMPDQLDPALGARLRAFHDGHKSPETAAPVQSSNPFVRSGQSQLSDIGDVSDAAVTSLLNLPHHAWESIKDLASSATFGGHVERTPGPANLSPTTQADLQPGPMGQAAIGGVKAADTALENASPGAHDLLHNTARVAGDVGDIAMVGGAAKGLTGEIAANATAAPAAVAKYGLRTAENNPIARNIAGESAQPAVAAHNQSIANQALGAQAGVAPGTPLTSGALEAARDAPNSVYTRAEKAIPTGPLSSKARGMINSVGADDMVVHSPDTQATIDAQKGRLSGDLTGPQVVNAQRALRFNGFRNIASQDPESSALGHAQLKMSDALHQHMLDTIPPSADVSAEQLNAARTALAQNHTVDNALKGNNVDLQALAKLHRDSPNMLSGLLKDFAEFADLHPEVSALPSKAERFNPSGVAKDVASVDLKSPATYLQPFFGAAARRIMTGPARTPEVPVTGAAGEFSPIDRTPQPPAGMTAGPMGSPSAPAGHPGDISLADLLSHGVEQPPAEGLSAGPMGAPPSAGIPFTRNAAHEAGGLSLMDELGGARQDMSLSKEARALERERVAALRDREEGISSQFEPEHIPLRAAEHEGTVARRMAEPSLMDVLSQGVPEDIMTRTTRPAPKRKAPLPAQLMDLLGGDGG